MDCLCGWIPKHIYIGIPLIGTDMNIMEVVSTAGVNGAITHCMMLTRELARRGHRVTLVALPDSWICGQLCHEPMRIVESDLHRWPADELIRIRKIAKREAVEVIHTHTSRAHFFGQMVSWLSGIPCVATAHTQNVQLNWMFHSRVVATSRATGRFQCTYNLVRPRRLDVVHNFVDVNHLVEIPTEARGEVRASLGLDKGSLVIGTVGSVIAGKGLVFLVRGLREIKAAVPKVKLLVVGSGPRRYTQKVKAEADRLGVSSCILWTGHRTDVPRLLTAMDVFVHPSLREALPLAVIEAMASALPVVAARVAGLPECVIHGETGYLVPRANHQALSERIIALLRDGDLRARFGEAGRRMALENFSTERQVPKIESILSRAAGGDRKPGTPMPGEENGTRCGSD